MADQDDNTRVLADHTTQRVGEHTEMHVLTRNSLERDMLRQHGRVSRNSVASLGPYKPGQPAKNHDWF